MANKSITLRDGTKMPLIGYGINQFENQELSVTSLEVAFDSGYRHFNTAFINSDERILGKAISGWIENGMVERKDLFVTTKLDIYYISTKSVEMFLDLSLGKLGLDYIDLYLIHFTHSCKCGEKTEKCFTNQMVSLENEEFLAIWKEMEDLVMSGKVRNIGFANVNMQRVSMVLNQARIKPAVMQIEVHPYIQNNELIKFCKEKGIFVLGYAPIKPSNTGIALKKSEPTSENDPCLIKDDVIHSIAKKHSKTPGQIVLRHMIERGIGTLTKTITHSRIKENIHIFDFELDETDLKELACLNKTPKEQVCQYIFQKFLDLPQYLYDL